MARADYPQPVKQLIAELKRLPSIGSRSAERIAIWLLQNKKAEPLQLSKALIQAKEQIIACPTCGFFATQDGCSICDDPKRDQSIICVVEKATDVIPLERSGAYHGLYHCLGGKLSPLDRISPQDLNIPSLLNRVKEDTEVEIILALGADVEGEATSNYLADLFRNYNRKITRLAQGLPAGGDLEHADDLTLIRALRDRRSF